MMYLERAQELERRLLKHFVWTRIEKLDPKLGSGEYSVSVPKHHTLGMEEVEIPLNIAKEFGVYVNLEADEFVFFTPKEDKESEEE